MNFYIIICKKYKVFCKYINMNNNLKNTIVASTSLIPFAGGILSVLFDKYIPSNYERKRDAFFTYIDNEFKRFNIYEHHSKLNDEAFIMLFTKSFNRAMEEYHEEKIRAFQNIIINSVLNKNEEKFDEISFFIRLVSDLTVDQIKILHLVKNKEFIKEPSIYKAITKLWGDADESYLMACVTELIRFNLVSNSKNNNEQTQFRQYLTPFGMRFINYISDFMIIKEVKSES